MSKLTFNSDWTQAGLKNPYDLCAQSKQIRVQQLVCSKERAGSPASLRTYFKYLVSLFKVFLLDPASFFYIDTKKRNNGFMLQCFEFQQCIPLFCFVPFGRIIYCVVCSETASPSGSKEALQQGSAEGVKCPLICFLPKPHKMHNIERQLATPLKEFNYEPSSHPLVVSFFFLSNVILKVFDKCSKRKGEHITATCRHSDTLPVVWN